jgi:cytochrome c biogenesis protein CcmG, thiol:disulfide interchange protein DsbE
VVNFWASWCVPCRDEFPLFKTAASANPGAGLVLVGVVFQDSADPARAFAAKAGATWPSVLDPSGAAASTWRVVAPPQTYFIDRSGVIVSRQIGELTQADLDRQLAAILR